MPRHTYGRGRCRAIFADSGERCEYPSGHDEGMPPTAHGANLSRWVLELPAYHLHTLYEALVTAHDAFTVEDATDLDPHAVEQAAAVADLIFDVWMATNTASPPPASHPLYTVVARLFGEEAMHAARDGAPR